MAMNKRVAVAVTGASGSVYAERFVGFLLSHIDRIYLVASDAGMQVADHELPAKQAGFCLRRVLRGDLVADEREKLRVFRNCDLFSPLASGSSCPTDLVIAPCSMGTLARVASGAAGNLIERSADVMIKEKRNLVLVPRETPLSAIHLENLLKLSQLGARIVPAMPAFYNKPRALDELVDFVVGRMVDAVGLEHELYQRWNRRMI